MRQRPQRPRPACQLAPRLAAGQTPLRGPCALAASWVVLAALAARRFALAVAAAARATARAVAREPKLRQHACEQLAPVLARLLLAQQSLQPQLQRAV